jgi:hypothetical protein
MSLVILEGLDRTGKSTVAAYFKSLGYEVIHMSSPPKGITSDEYFQEMVDLVSSAAARDICLDRSHYGELLWPIIFGREPLLSEENIEAIREIEDTVGVTRIWMYDPDVEAHWKRCVENKEPLDKAQFVKARSLYSRLAHKYGFEPVTLQQFLKKFPDAEKYLNQDLAKTDKETINDKKKDAETVETETFNSSNKPLSTKTPEQLKLEKANAINDILSKRILRLKGPIYDELEDEVRNFLNEKLGKLLGGSSKELSFTQEEIKFYKEMYKRVIEKGDN